MRAISNRNCLIFRLRLCASGREKIIIIITQWLLLQRVLTTNAGNLYTYSSFVCHVTEILWHAVHKTVESIVMGDEFDVLQNSIRQFEQLKNICLYIRSSLSSLATCSIR